MAPAFSVDIPGRIRGALIGRPHDTATYDDVLDARPRPLPVLAERLAARWKIKTASAHRRLEAFLRDGASMDTDRVADILGEVGLTLAPGEDSSGAGGYVARACALSPATFEPADYAFCNVRMLSEVEPE